MRTIDVGCRIAVAALLLCAANQSLLGQTLGAAGVAILFRAYGAAGPKFALGVAALLALTAAVVSTVRLTARTTQEAT